MLLMVFAKHTEYKICMVGQVKIWEDFMPNYPFYQTQAWKRKRHTILIRDNFLCQYCKRRPAKMVHHIKCVKDFPELALVDENLVSLCYSCHEEQHPERHKQAAAQKVSPFARIIQI